MTRTAPHVRWPLIAGLCVAVLAGCSNPDRFGADNTVDLNAPNTAFDPAAGDPTSIAYFASTVGDRVLFQVDESTLTPEARSILSDQAVWLNQNLQYSVLIEGHADEQGTREYNLGLGARRASAVQQFLISQGVGPNRMRTVTYGKERPLEICSQEVCYEKNRRAVTVVSGGAS